MSSADKKYIQTIEEQLAARTSSAIAHLEENLQDCIKSPVSQRPAEQFLTSKPLAVWLNVDGDNITEVSNRLLSFFS